MKRKTRRSKHYGEVKISHVVGGVVLVGVVLIGGVLFAGNRMMNTL